MLVWLGIYGACFCLHIFLVGEINHRQIWTKAPYGWIEHEYKLLFGLEGRILANYNYL